MNPQIQEKVSTGIDFFRVDESHSLHQVDVTGSGNVELFYSPPRILEADPALLAADKWVPGESNITTAPGGLKIFARASGIKVVTAAGNEITVSSSSTNSGEV